MEELIAALLRAPEHHMSDHLRGMIATWSSPPTGEEIITTRNAAAYTSECSSFVISILNVMIEMTENKP